MTQPRREFTQGTRGRASPPPHSAPPVVLVVVQGGMYPTDPALAERLLRGDEVGTEARVEGSASVDVGDRIDVAALPPGIVRSLIANRLAVPADVAVETNAALRAEYGEYREAEPGVMAGVRFLDPANITDLLGAAPFVPPVTPPVVETEPEPEQSEPETEPETGGDS